MKKLLILFTLIFLMFVSCNDNTTNPFDKGAQNLLGKSNLRIYLVDSSSLMDSLIIYVERIEAQKSGSDSTLGWFVVNNNLRRFDLLQLRNGVSVVLGDTLLDSGQYSKIRLILSDSNYAVDQGVKHSLIVPSELKTGINLYLNFILIPDSPYALVLDFNAEKSVYIADNGQYIMRPSIRIIPQTKAGTVSGKILPTDAQATVFTTIKADTISTNPNPDGYFMLTALPGGLYNVHILPDTSKYIDSTLVQVIVSANRDTYMDIIQLKSK